MSEHLKYCSQINEYWLNKNVCLNIIYIHTYIIGHYNPSVRIIDLVSHTTYVVCVNFYMWVAGPLREICWEQIAEEMFFFYISFWCLTWGLNSGLTSNKPTHCLEDYGATSVFIHTYIIGHYNPSIRIIDLVSMHSVWKFIT